MNKEIEKFINNTILLIAFILAIITGEYLWFIALALFFIYFKEEDRKLNLTLIMKKENILSKSTKEKMRENARKMPRGYHGRFIKKSKSKK